MKRIAEVSLWVFGGLLTLVLGFIGYVEWRWVTPYDAPYPAVKADMSPEAMARGRALFEVKCLICHRAEGSPTASGKPLADVPKELGTIYSANLTRDERAGIGKLTDEEIARAVRFGVTHDGRRSVMGWGLSDEDLAAVIGYLRSDDPLFAGDPKPMPKTELTLLGKAIVASVYGAPPAFPATELKAPLQSDLVARGSYLAREVYDCAECHTEGFGRAKYDADRSYAGGQKLVQANGEAIFTANLTFHETGLAGWSREDFGRALTLGLAADGTPLRAPMPKFRTASEADLDALYAFFRSLPPRPAHGAAARRTPHPPKRPAEAPAGRAPKDLFVSLGCIGCHGPGAPQHQAILDARGKPPERLAAWIRHPEQFKPGTQMPTFAPLLTEAEALELGRWVSEGNVPAPIGRR
ncbi:MAG: c-type cytochrome [Myxococcaceae bacterium]|nr:c-type cytochrome [Myxococcaceae bacterium]